MDKNTYDFIDTLPPNIIDAIYEKKHRTYLIQDAKERTQDCSKMDEIDYPSIFTSRSYDLIATFYENNHDCNEPDNDQWYQAIRYYYKHMDEYYSMDEHDAMGYAALFYDNTNQCLADIFDKNDYSKIINRYQQLSSIDIYKKEDRWAKAITEYYDNIDRELKSKTLDKKENNTTSNIIMTETMYEELKRAVFDAGINAIEDLLGCELEFNSDKDMLEAITNVLYQMPDDIALKFYNKYCK